VATQRTGVSDRSRRSTLGLVLRGGGLLVAIPAGTAAAVVMGTAWRRRHRQFQGFPHPAYPPVHGGANTIQLYSYGRDLYAVMLDAIDTAQESVYLESFLSPTPCLKGRGLPSLTSRADAFGLPR